MLKNMASSLIELNFSLLKHCKSNLFVRKNCNTKSNKSPFRSTNKLSLSLKTRF